ncbi:MAG: glycosyltransferase family 2 protein [Candidatus Omnitrophica bacterium]|nr:glycosyltransferase family 2 protein [Candidatus Omnitrophota bacterium]
MSILVTGGLEPLCDLVLLSWNHLECTRPCVESLFAHTQVPSRLIIVDNGSTDPDFLRYLAALPGKSPLPVQVVRLPHNQSIASALNEGLRQTSAPWVCLLNNDILATPGWLSEMIRVAQANPRIGLLNPMSNQFAALPNSSEAINGHAETLLKEHAGEWVENWESVGFCMLLNRSVLEKVGLFDEGFQPFFFEDTDYSMKVRAAGLDCAIAQGAYVHHHQGSTLKLDPSRSEQFRRNNDRFHRKWNLPPPMKIGWVIDGSDPDPDRMREEIRSLANQGHLLWVLAARNRNALLRHRRVVEKRLSPWLFPGKALIFFLAKKKKVDRLVLPNRPGFRNRLWKCCGREIIYRGTGTEASGPIAH